MIEALIEGETLKRSLISRWGNRLLLKEIIAHIDFLEHQMQHQLEEIEARMKPGVFLYWPCGVICKSQY